MEPRDAWGPRERMLWAGLAVIVGVLADGPGGCSDVRAFRRIEAACRSFGVPWDLFEELASRFDFHYYAPMDCYLGREALAEARRADRAALH